MKTGFRTSLANEDLAIKELAAILAAGHLRLGRGRQGIEFEQPPAGPLEVAGERPLSVHQG